MNGFIIRLFMDGGLFFTVPIFFLLMLIIGIWIKAQVSDRETNKAISLITHIGWFALAWGYLGRTIGLIDGFDSVAQTGEYAPHIVSATLKKALLGPFFGLVSFLIARLGIILLNLKGKAAKTND